MTAKLVAKTVSRNVSGATDPFAVTLQRHGLELNRGRATTLQVNVGRLCNQVCKHCHLDAGPTRSEIMTRETVKDVLAFARRASFQVVDITGGAPELNPNLVDMIEWFAGCAPRIIVRSNLTSLADGERQLLMEVCKSREVAIVASLPALNSSQAEAQRGKGVFDKSLSVLRKLNSIGYGIPGAGLELSLVSNPAGAFLPLAQDRAEKKFRLDLQRKWGIVFNNFYAFANVPLGRFRKWLIESGNFDTYMQKLASNFNPCTVEGLMCRSLVSVSWDGYVYDCDFNQAVDVPAANVKLHVSELNSPPAPGAPIAVSDHCYACTAGSGFT
ncbi:MAG: arsenosugar biosynthesis radical SAM (seleno)protein ArsS [Desulfomonilaceae bacterium]